MDIQVYMFIFTLKILEVGIYALRMVLLTSGEKFKSSFLSFFEVIVWAFGTGLAAKLIMTDFYILIPYLLGGVVGAYLGMTIQEYVSKRDTIVMTFFNQNKFDEITLSLRENNYGLTVLTSLDDEKMLLVATKKNRISHLKKIIKSIDNNSTIITNAAEETIGGYIY
jgi:uncharacterized protein YebE (UPF0316 family)